ncbi:MAG: hypothetical protein WBX17_01690 [Microbacterium sp.]
MHSENPRPRKKLGKKALGIGVTLGVMSTLLLAPPAMADTRDGAMFCSSSRPHAILRTVHTGQSAEHRRNNQSGAIMNSAGAGSNIIMSSYYGTYTQGWWAWTSGAFHSLSATCNS